MATNLEIFTPIWETASPKFQERIPQPSRDNFERIGILLESDDYTQERNEIYEALVNLIGKQKVLARSINNPLTKMVNRGTMAFGDTYQEIMSDIIEGLTFRIGNDDQFEKFDHKVESSYHKINREQLYPVTIEETKIARAFKAEGGLQRLINSIVNQMYSSNNLDELLFTKKTIAMYYDYLLTKFPGGTAQIIEVPDVEANLLDRNVISAFVMTVKGVINEMRWPKRLYNPHGFMMNVDPSEFGIVLKSSVTVSQEVMTLANTFHPEYADFKVPITGIDNFNDGMDDIIGIIYDKSWLGCLEILRTVRVAHNARALYTNHFYHVHQLYYASLFSPVVFLKKAP